MRTIRGVAVAVGLGFLAVGCGPAVDSTKETKPTDPKPSVTAGTNPVDKTKDEAAKAKELGDKVKEIGDAANKELVAIDTAMKGLGEKIKEAGGDVNKLSPLKKLQDEANVLLGDLKKKIADLAGKKDVASLDAAKVEITKVVDDLKAKLKDHLPK